jgi:hypothetical protein
LFEEGGHVAAALLADAAVEDDMADVGFGEPAGEVVEGVVEGAKDQGLLTAFENLGDEGQDRGGLDCWRARGTGPAPLPLSVR